MSALSDIEKLGIARTCPRCGALSLEVRPQTVGRWTITRKVCTNGCGYSHIAREDYAMPRITRRKPR